MARPHHRKKHKSHLRQYQQSQHTTTSRSRNKASSIFAIVGAVAGLAVAYFASQGDTIWILAGLVLGFLFGYILGKQVEKGSK